MVFKYVILKSFRNKKNWLQNLLVSEFRYQHGRLINAVGGNPDAYLLMVKGGWACKPGTHIYIYRLCIHIFIYLHMYKYIYICIHYVYIICIYMYIYISPLYMYLCMYLQCISTCSQLFAEHLHYHTATRKKKSAVPA